MARSIAKRSVPAMALPEPLVPVELKFFRPPKGVDGASPLSEIPREYGAVIDNLVLDRGVLRSRWGTEIYHNKQAGKALQLTADIRGAAQNSVVLTDRTTAGLSNNGWTDPDGSPDNQNIVTGGPGTTVVSEANRLYNIIGDPTAGSNVDAYNDQYFISFSLSIDHGTVPNGWTTTTETTIECSTDGGASWFDVSGTFSVSRTTVGVTTTPFTATVVVSGVPTQVRFRLRTRLLVQGPSGTATGTVAASAPITWQTSASSSTPARLPTRWTESHLQFYEDASEVAVNWTDRYTFPASQKNTDGLLPTYVIWNDTIVSTDVGDTPQVGAGTRIGSKGLISTLLALPHTTSILANSPRAAQLFILGNRIVAVRTNDWTSTTSPWVDGGVTNLNRVRWSVKNNSNDWTGLGSGFEDFPVPGGSTDEAMAGVSITDETGIVVSERSIRRMDVTGFFDAPFRFTLLTDELGTLSRYTVKGIPGGAIFLGYDDVFLLLLSGPKRIGSIALRDSIAQISNRRLATGYFDQFNSRYLLAFKEGSTQVVWQYSFFDEGWTRIRLPFDVVNIDMTFYELLGTTFFGAYFTQSITGGYSVRENPSLQRDVDTAGVATDSELEARTGLVMVKDNLHKVQTVEAQLVYEAEVSQTLTLEYSVDGGDTWAGFGQIAISPTTRRTVARVAKVVVADALQLRVKSLTLGKLKVISLHAFVVEGARIQP